MKKPISRKMHGLADYSYVAFVASAPAIVGFEDEKTAVKLTTIMSGAALLSATLTKAEWGLLRVIPFKAHLAADAALSVFALGAPWLFRFAAHQKARNLFLGIGLFGIAASLLSKPKEMKKAPLIGF